MKLSKILFFLIPLISSCGHVEGTIQPDRAGYIRFIGNVSGAQAMIDGESFMLTANSDSLYETTPGKHHIQVQKDGMIKVNRNLMIGNGATKEVKVP